MYVAQLPGIPDFVAQTEACDLPRRLVRLPHAILQYRVAVAFPLMTLASMKCLFSRPRLFLSWFVT